MENWSDQGIVLSARQHGENGAVVALLTENNGRHAGFVHGARSTKQRGRLEAGTRVSAEWSAKTSDNLGTYKIEQEQGLPAGIMDDPLKLGALMSACALCDAALPEREGHPGLFAGMRALIEMLETEYWGPAYVMWEISFLRELGFGLELSKCAGGGDSSKLTHVSPKTGRAVSAEQAEPYKDRLLPLPDFLRPQGVYAEAEDILQGIQMTGHFLENWAFAHHSKGVPEPRLRFEARYAKTVAGSSEKTSLEDILHGQG